MYSVIIPSLGRLSYLNELIKSILAQTIPPLEILLLLDDNEHCREISSAIQANELLILHYCANLNLAEKRNFGALLASSDNLLFSDDDDTWEPNKGELVFDALKLAPVCCHNYGKFGSSLALHCGKLGKENINLSAIFMLAGSNRFGGGSAIAAKRYIVLALPFSSEFQYCEDFEWWSRILFTGIDVLYLGSTLVMYRTHASNMTSAINTISHFGNKLAMKLLQSGMIMLVSAMMIALRSLFRPPKSFFRNSTKLFPIYFFLKKSFR